MIRRIAWLLLLVFIAATTVSAAEPADSADQRLADYFAAQTRALQEQCLAEIETAADWNAKREQYRQQLLEMLGLHPQPEKTDLQAVVTGVAERDDIVVERVQFQSRPGLFVTANLYRPRRQEQPLPAILYVCGHGNVKVDGVSFGSKAHYQHHGVWFARNGYVCLTIDTLQLGEIEGIHHGTYRYGRWWWPSRGYTPAGVEAWNCVRALDYLQSRKEVDGERLGVTGRSGGGAYSWWIAAIDERIKAAVPVAGITDLENHVVDGCVEGHCDCMYFVNTFQWDYPLVAALVAPRPLLISNTDNDRIFPLEGVVRTHRAVRRIYRLLDAEQNLALQITAGPHKDTQELRVHAFRWFNHFLKGDDSLLRMPAEREFEPAELKVFSELPAEQKNTAIDETFVAMPKPAEPPTSEQQWRGQSESWRELLRQKVFRAWPKSETPETPGLLRQDELARDGLTLRRVTFRSQPHVELALWIVHSSERPAKLVVLNALNQQQWDKTNKTLAELFPASAGDGKATEAKEDSTANTSNLGEDARSLRDMLRAQPWAMAYLAPRGVGPDRWSGDERKQNQLQRRFYLLGQTLDGMRVWDIRQATRALREHPSLQGAATWLQAEGDMSGVALHAAVFEDYGRVDLYGLQPDYRSGPTLLNASRLLTLPQTVALAAARNRLVLYGANADDWSYVTSTAKQLGWDSKQFQLRNIEP